MSLSYLFALYLLCHLGLTTYAFRLQTGNWRIWLLRILLLGMIYDNSMLLLSSLYGAADWLKALNYPRWVIHSAVLPFLTLYTLSLLRQSGLQMASTRWLTAVFVVVTAACWVFGVWHEILLLELAPKLFTDPAGIFADMERFSSVSTTPPLATIFTNLFVIPWAFVIWRLTGWRWFALGALAIFLINGASGASPWGLMAGNLGEIVFMVALLLTERRFATSAHS